LPDHYDAAPADEPDPEARQQFAEQVAAGARDLFPVRDRVVLRLHLEGESYRDIAGLVGGDFTWIGKRVEKMKARLRTAFGQAWAELNNG
jgi:DNA-directed RNA polymerase specialized sigma24 family protein